MTRFAVKWPAAFGGHRIFASRAEALDQVARVRVNRGEEAVITEIPDEPDANAARLSPEERPNVEGTPSSTTLTGEPAPPWAVRPDCPSTQTRAVDPNELVDEVLALLAEDEDLRVRTHIARVLQYRRERAAGVAIPRRYRFSNWKPF